MGGSVAGVSAADGLRERGYGGRITILDAGSDLPHDKPPLSKSALAGVTDLAATVLRPAAWYDEQGIELRLGTKAVGVDAGSRQLLLQSGQALGFDGLVIATGAVPRPVRAPGADPRRLHVLRTVADARRLREELRPGRHLAVIGGGFIGLEVAATARALGLEVTVVEAAPSLLSRAFPAEVGQWFERLHRDHGVAIRCASAPQEITVAGDCIKVRLPDATLRADVVLAGIGCTPAVDWLAGSGIRTGDGVLCAEDLNASVPHVVAAGDVVRWHNQAMAEEMRVEHWTNAVEQGRHAASTLLGEHAPYQAIPYFWTDQFDARVRFVGRAAPGDDIAVSRPRDGALVALFGRAGTLRGALCANAPRHLAQYSAAVKERVPWHDAVSGLPG